MICWELEGFQDTKDIGVISFLFKLSLVIAKVEISKELLYHGFVVVVIEQFLAL